MAWPPVSAAEWHDWAYLVLSFITIVVFFPVVAMDFISLDDPSYVMKNPHVASGLSFANVSWAFSALHANVSYWHPLTWLSHQLDCAVFGLRPSAHHFGNLLLHLGGGLLLFRFLKEATKEWLRGAIVAALFCLHPLHVETVAWVAERKGVLSGLFWMATLNAYLGYTRAPSAGRYLLVLLSFAAGLASKPIVVTLPAVLLLLDYWPLGRLAGRIGGEAGGLGKIRLASLLIEKAPLLALSLIVSMVTFVAQREIRAVVPLNALPIADRVDNATMAYLAYLWKTVWPVDLSVIYTHSGTWPFWEVLLAGCSLLGLSWGCFCWRGRCPYLLVGWLWFLITLTPMIGIVQVGAQFIADRYTYISIIGLFIAAVWLAADLAEGRPQMQKCLAVLVSLVLIAAIGGTRRQLRCWDNSVTLFSHALEVAPGNAVAHCHLAVALVNAWAYAAADEHLRQAIRIVPNTITARELRGNLLLDRGRPKEAIECFKEILALSSVHQEAHYMLGLIYSTHPDGQFRDGRQALAHARIFAAAADPTDERYLDLLAAAYAENDDFTHAVEMAQQAYALASAAEIGMEEARERLDRYRRKEPLHMVPHMGKGLFISKEEAGQRSSVERSGTRM